ncbi:hypothetical protein SY85_18320 [Flavisolibacter tropicus]|uniref:Uncharacterized protein n=2 Tax=Flavisolibacter tropicus TaxID=1492898 RepID=A0A172TZJ5_9BACT|nr:hypothetical protein SY85_18320 [Flavisolibacter tropicus]
MKHLTIAVALVLTLATVSWQSRNKQVLMKPQPCDAIMDSVSILIQAGGLVVEASEDTTAMGKRYSGILFWLQDRPFTELQCLLTSNNPLHRTYGFILCGQRYPDSITRHLDLLKDTSHILLYVNNKLIDPEVTVGQIIEMMYKKILQDKADQDRLPEVQNRVNAFICEYAAHPPSFKVLSFDKYSFGGVDKTEMYSVRLTYLLKNNSGRLLRQTSEFVLDSNLRINVIEKDSTSYFNSYPPILDVWLNIFGRKLSAMDSAQLRLK